MEEYIQFIYENIYAVTIFRDRSCFQWLFQYFTRETSQRERSAGR